MPLPWVRLDTQFPSNPKVLDLVSDGQYQAAFLYVCSLSYCGAHGTDGFIPTKALTFIHGTKDAAAQLVRARLWDADKKGWFIPDYLDYQQSSEKTEQIRASKVAAGRKGNCARWHEKGCECWRDL